MTAPIEVCSLRDRGEPQDRDVVCTRPGPWGNPFTVERYGWRALDCYHGHLRQKRGSAMHALKRLAGARLLCACSKESLACHVWIIAEEVDRLTGCGVVPAPGRRRP